MNCGTVYAGHALVRDNKIIDEILLAIGGREVIKELLKFTHRTL